MNRTTKYLVIDVETANSLGDPLVYDVGYAVADRNGNIYFQESFIIYDIFRLEQDMMRSCYYCNKIPQYVERLKNGQTKSISFLSLQKRIHRIMEHFNITTVCAYNCHFDRMALNTTLRYLTKSRKRWFFPYGTEFNCIWHMACQMIYKQRKFATWALDNDYISRAGNIQTNAEVGTQYLNDDTDFTEQHMGLDDVLIECAIMAMCYKKHKKMDKSINRLCWKIPTENNINLVNKYLKEKRGNNYDNLFT